MKVENEIFYIENIEKLDYWKYSLCKIQNGYYPKIFIYTENLEKQIHET